MKIKKIADVCKRAHCISLQDVAEGEAVIQWLGDASVSYRMDNAPYLTEQNLYTMFDIDEKKRRDFRFYHNIMTELPVLSKNIEDTETYLFRTQVEIKLIGLTVVGLYGELGTLLVNQNYLRPLENLEQVGYYQRKDSKGQEYVVAKDGMLTVAVIYPTRIGKRNSMLVKELQDITAIIYSDWESSQEQED